MPIYALIISLIILICLWLNKISNKLGVPTLLLFIFLGMLFGSDGIFKIHFDNYAFAEIICSTSLIFIMFYGGFGTNWNKAKPIAIKSILLSTFGVILTSIITGLFCFYVLKFDFLESMLVGAVISSTDAASVFSILRSKRLNLKYNTASLLEVESGSNDPCSNIFTILILSFINSSPSGSMVLYTIFSQIVYGIILGIVIAVLASFILSRFKFSTDGFDSIFVFSVALISYSVTTLIGGNGYLSTYITGIILGNIHINNKKSLVNFFDGLTGLMQILIFFLLGLLSFPSQLPNIFIPALSIALFLTFVARPLVVFTILSPFKCKLNQQLLISWSGLRGAASIVFAIMTVVSPAYTKNDIFHIVFFIVLFSISIQGSLIPFVAKKLNMIDDSSDVMRTFNDYSEEIPVQFIKLLISQNHPWVNKKIKDIKLLPDVLTVLILRNDKQIIPKGNTHILCGDIVVLSGLSIDDKSFGYLTEIKIEKDNNWLGMALSEIKFGSNKLVILIKRNNRVIIPSGSTIIKENDTLIINQSKN